MTSDFVIRVAETGDVPQMQAIAHDAYNVYVEKMRAIQHPCMLIFIRISARILFLWP